MSKLLVICVVVMAVAAVASAASADCEQAAKQWMVNHNQEHPSDKIAKLVDILSCSQNGFPKYTVMSVKIEKAKRMEGQVHGHPILDWSARKQNGLPDGRSLCWRIGLLLECHATERTT